MLAWLLPHVLPRFCVRALGACRDAVDVQGAAEGPPETWRREWVYPADLPASRSISHRFHPQFEPALFAESLVLGLNPSSSIRLIAVYKAVSLLNVVGQGFPRVLGGMSAGLVLATHFVSSGYLIGTFCLCG